MRLIKLPLPFYNAEGGTGGGGASGPAASGSAPSGGSSPAPSSPSAASSPSSGGGSPESSPAPSPSPSDAPSSSAQGDEGSDFSALGEPSSDDLESLMEPPPAGAEPPAEPPPQDAPPAVPTAAAAPPAEPGTPSAAAPSPTGQQENSPPFSLAEPDKIAQALSQNSEEIIKHLATNEFKLSEKDLEALEADAPAHIPTLLARVHLQGQINMHRQFAQIVPQMISKVMQTVQRNKEAEDKFYSAFPQIDRVKHGPTVLKYARVFRQNNPQASFEEMAQTIGPVLMGVLKIDPTAAPSQNGRAGTPVFRTPPQPFRPAIPGPSALPAAQEQNEWAGLAPSADSDE